MNSPSKIFESNLSRLRRTDPELADRLVDIPSMPLQWGPSKSGPLTALIEQDGRQIALASRYDPMEEARQLVERVDFKKHGGIVALGMGLGYHVGLIGQRLDDSALLVVFEPDLAELKATLERIDHTDWLGHHNIILADSQMDRALILARVERFAGSLTQGTILLTHPASRRRHGEALETFAQMVTEVLSYCRTNIATTLVNASRTIYNLSMNLPYYAAGANTDDLFNLGRGYPAVCVGAGPSLARNIHLLLEPRHRQNVMLITAQTTLKPLIERGIRPDFVTALDYSTISRRFYEGLTDLADVTIVAEPLAHPTILENFPGPKRVTSNRFLDRLLGDLVQPMVPIPLGTTVAHLSFYLAQHLGCDPIILIGQDLGFSNGLYYCPGTAIHDVWAPELGPFNTLEMMEWQRIVRHRGHLKKIEDIHGQEIYSDEQMRTYLKQFERDFASASQTVLDATEGGLPKEHCIQTTFAAALDEHARRPVPRIPLPKLNFDDQRLARLANLMGRRISQVDELRRLSRRTVPILKQMHKHQRDQTRLNKLFDQLNPIRRRVNELADIFMIINDLNTIGAFKRARADRAIEQGKLDSLDEQRQCLERDIENVDWLVQACDEATDIFRKALANLSEKIQANRERTGQAVAA